MIKLSSRLKKISDYVDDNSNVIDIGCDHGLLDIYLIEKKKNITVLASDINSNALIGASKNIKKYKLEDKINLVQSDGLDNIDTKGMDTIIIAGMGSHTMVGILQKNIRKLKNISHLILQSNNDLDFLRYKVVKLGYYIEDEELIKDAGIIYTIIKFRRGYRFYTKKDYYFGPCLLKKKDSLFLEKNERELQKNKKIYKVIPKGHYFYRMKVKRRIKLLENNI